MNFENIISVFIMPNYVLPYFQKRSVLKYGNSVTVGSPELSYNPIMYDIIQFLVDN